MGFHSELNKLANNVSLPLSVDNFKLFIADVHLLHDKSWDKKSMKISSNFPQKIIKSSLRTNIPLKIYSSIEEASHQTNIPKNSIIKVCNGKQKTAGGYKWSFYEDIE
jgi:hypothetical protein